MKSAIRQASLSILFLVLISLSGLAQNNGELGTRLGVTGKSYISYSGGFIVTPPPNYPTFQQKKSLLSDKKTELNIYSASISGLNYSANITVSYNFFEDTNGRSAQEILEIALRGGLNEAGAVLEKRESITLQGYPGLSYYATINDKNSGQQIYARMKIVLSRHRLYQLCFVTTRKADLNSFEVESMFKSFVLIN
jgi:hypothetical protein